jgi:hypothetical protein
LIRQLEFGIMTNGIRAELAGDGSASSQALQDLSSRLLTLRQGDFSAKIDKVLVYVQSAAKSNDPKTLSNFIRFAHLNLDAILIQALEALVSRPRLASKSDEQKKADALQKTFDRLDNPEKALLEHYRATSDPLNKYLVAGPWGHEYLKKRSVEIEALEVFDGELCELLGCGDKPGGWMVLAYAGISRDLERLRSEKQKSIPCGGQE